MASRYSAVNDGRDESPHRTQRGGRGKLPHEGTAGWTSSVTNLANTILGAGVLAMPHAMSASGLFLGVAAILFSGFTSGLGLYFQSLCARRVDKGNASFFTVAQRTYPGLAVVFDAAIAVKCFGVGVSYLIIIGDLMPQVIGSLVRADSLPFLLDRHFWVTAFMLIIIPLAFLRRLDSLKYTSVVALSSVVYLVVIVVGHYLLGDTADERGEVRQWAWQSSTAFFSAVPVIVFAFTCHQNMFSILNEIRDDSPRSVLSVIGTSIGASAAIYLLVGLTGYLSYGSNVGGNIISMYPNSAAATIGRTAIVVLFLFSYPLQCHPCRASLDHALRWRPSRIRLPPPPPPPSPPSPQMSDARFALLTAAIVVLSYTTSMSVASLEIVLAFVGSTGSTAISFILPGLFFWRISRDDNLLKDDDDESEHADEFHGARAPWFRWAALGLASYGIVVMALCLTMNIVHLALGRHINL